MLKKIFQPHKPPDKESRKIYAEFLSERIYGTITLLAVCLNMYANYETVTLTQAFSTILATALGLWAASLFAEYTAYHVVHDHVMSRKNAMTYLVTHRGILTSAVPALILLTVAYTGIIEVKTALLTSIIVACSVILLLIFYAAQSTTDSSRITIAAIISQTIVAAIIIVILILGK